ncbi:hypothetical protein RRG08_018760 [Elysia crispata]|uniref:Uncharacterized protein n=1 Tax=Elysia crispata TaxID=231223 RepID=A0AAE1E908_9GAST|nr:hypothetical protein RRG08_018760 [Elysia crispata]
MGCRPISSRVFTIHHLIAPLFKHILRPFPDFFSKPVRIEKEAAQLETVQCILHPNVVKKIQSNDWCRPMPQLPASPCEEGTVRILCHLTVTVKNIHYLHFRTELNNIRILQALEKLSETRGTTAFK